MGVKLLVDGAGWHKAKDLAVPKNIKIIILPPYSRELNPIERLWQHIKDNVLKNHLLKGTRARSIPFH
jgi:transposase